jgi:phospholipid/cholesterol/gamma-HCH transport system permease protein
MLSYLGRILREKLTNFSYAAGFFFQTLKLSLPFFRSKTVGFRILTQQILFTGVDALSIIGILSLSLGAVIIIQGQTVLAGFGTGTLMYEILVIVITRELGPVLTAFIVIARSGTAIATEIGNMVVSNEIEAYVVHGINPISYLVVPRFLGVTISVFLLNIYFNIFGLAGSYFLVRIFRPLEMSVYLQGLLTHLGLVDILSSGIKALSFGAIISLVATYSGFQVESSSTEIPIAVIRAVGRSVVYVIVADGIITLISYV